MWAKIETKPYDKEIIYLPKVFEKKQATITIHFGGVSIITSAVYSDEIDYEEESSFEKPQTIIISDKLKDTLCIPDSLVYQVKISDSFIDIGPVIGLLLGIHTHRYNPKHMKKYSDRMGIYNKIGGLIYAFSPKSINWKKNTAYGLFYNISKNEWKYGCFPLPEVIYRRDFHSDPLLIKKLMDFTKGRLFNSYRFTKYELYDYVSLNDELKKKLPATELVHNFENIRKFIDSHPKSILKPIDLSRGRGICVIERIDNIYKVSDYRYKSPIVSILNDKESFEKFISLNENLLKNYIIQQYLPLARIGNSLFDVRVVMQKRKGNQWQNTGIECRVSGDSHLTNISRGGYALTLDEALRQSFKEDYEYIPSQIDDFCQEFCHYMDESDEHYAELGIDIAVDIHKNIWLIEANVFPSFKGFKKIDWQTYLAIRYTSMLYALSLTKFGEAYDE
jgi:hypothetical protein